MEIVGQPVLGSREINAYLIHIIVAFEASLVKLGNITTGLTNFLLSLFFQLLQFLLALCCRGVDDSFLQAEHAAIAQLLHNDLCLLDRHLAENLVDFVQGLGCQCLLQVFRESVEDLAYLNLSWIFAISGRNVDSDLGVGVNSVQLDLLYARRIVGC